MASPTEISAYVALFALTGFLFLFANLLIGWLVRPNAPNQEKLEIYECGEPTIGSSFVQFDLRFYVVALLFIIFDVEVAFFFPWAAVFGKATLLADENAPVAAAELNPGAPDEALQAMTAVRLRELGLSAVDAEAPGEVAAGGEAVASDPEAIRQAARRLALTSFADIGVFFGVLLVGFAYVWRRGDLDWVRATTRQHAEPMRRAPPTRALEPSQSILSA